MANWTLTIGDQKEDVTFNKLTTNSVYGLGKLMLSSLNIQKEIYTPGHIEAVVQVTPEKPDGLGAVNFQSLLGMTVTVNDGTIDIAKDYIIFECLPVYKPSGSNTSLYLTLSIYSPEYCLTLKKSNKCYVSKRFGSEVFKTIASNHSAEIKNFSYDNLANMWIQHIVGGQQLKGRTEFIVPYLVQCEETELDFLNRIANLHGEFLYYENGVWQLGYNGAAAHSSVKQNINDGKYISASFKKLTTKDEDDEAFHGLKEDYLETFTESDFDLEKEWKGRMGFNSFQGWLFNVGTWAKKANLSEIATTVLLDVTKNAVKSEKKMRDSAAEWDKVHFEPFKDEPEHYTTVKGKKTVCPFSNYDASTCFGKEFYQEIRREEKKSINETVHIDFGTNYVPLLLCDQIEILGSTYTITKISTGCKYVVTDKITNKGITYITLEVDAVPYAVGSCYPPLLEKEPTRRIESQTGIVTANDDPLNLGRIQFRYSWQDDAKPSSPWIPVAQPFASKDAAIKFAPQVGDEIIIGYEYGEIERPFMIGALTTKANKLESVENKIASVENAVPNTKYNNDFVIKSPNGHYLKFMSPNKGSGLFNSFFPGIKTWLGYIPASWDFLTDNVDAGRNFNGAISMGDAFGLVNINMSTDKRKILIQSALGDVQIDAFTGITISAPNGDVKIEGKNVEIVAGNNLTLKSGANVDKMKKYYSKKFFNANAASMGSALLDEAKKHIKLVDLKLLRTICDAVVKPVGGTMLLKSKRYLRLEAGKGSTALSKKAYEKGSDQQRDVLAAKIKEMKVKDTINATVNLINWYERNYSDANTKFKEAIRVYNGHINMWMSEMKSFISAGGIVKYNKQIQEADIVKDKFEKATDIWEIAKSDNRQAKEVHQKLDKFTFEIGQSSNPFKLGRLETRKAAAITAAESIAILIKEYLLSVKNMDNNVNGKVQTDIINIGDKELWVLPDEEYKNEIFYYLSIEAGEDNDRLILDRFQNANQYEGQNQESTGARNDIYMRLPAEIADLHNFGQAADVKFDSVEKRKIIYRVIQRLKDANLVTIKNEAGFWNELTLDHDANRSVLNNENVCEDVEKWKSYLDCVKPYEPGTSWKGVIVKGLNLLGFESMTSGWSEDVLYNPDTEGEILLSDTDGNTCKISGEKISSTPTSDVKSAMGILKKI